MATTRFIDHLLEGDHASRPAAGDVPEGTLYSCTTHSLVYQSDTATWTTWATLGGSSDLDAIIAASSGQNIADALAGAASPAAGNVFATMADVSGGAPEPWLIEVSLFMGAHGNTNWSTQNIDSAELFAGDIESSGAQNDEIYWDIGVSGGTWDFAMLHLKGANRGIYTVSIDGSSIGTIDGYNATPVKNVLSSITGASISSGKRRLKLKMATKNASSSNYYGTVQAWQLRRTA